MRRHDLRDYVTGHLGDPAAVLVVDETGDLKKGTATVGVQRQYTGTAGRIENSQVAVYLTYAAPAGYAFIDRDLYLPRSGTDDPARCATAGVPGDVTFATKPALARVMIDRALDAGVPTEWAAGDEVYGADPTLRKDPARRGLRAGGGQVPPVHHRHRHPPGHRPGRPAAQERLAAPLGRHRRQGANAGTTGPWSRSPTRPSRTAPARTGC